MNFNSADPSIVKSIKQLDFLKTWQRLHAKCRSLAPSAKEYLPARVEDDKADLMYYRVEWNRGVPRILIDSEGSRVAEAYGRGGTDNQGRYLDDYLEPDAVSEILPIYHECIRRALPVYTVSSVDDVDGRHVDCERLLLPFSDGIAVTEIIASLKTISCDGRFEIRELFRATDRRPILKFRAVIDRNAAGRRPVTCDLDDDVIEI